MITISFFIISGKQMANLYTHLKYIDNLIEYDKA